MYASIRAHPQVVLGSSLSAFNGVSSQWEPLESSPKSLETPTDFGMGDYDKTKAVSSFSDPLVQGRYETEIKSHQLGQQLGAFKDRLREIDLRDHATSTMPESNNHYFPASYSTERDDLVRKIAESQGRLHVSNQLAQFLQSSLSQAEDAKMADEAKARGLEAMIESLRVQLRGKEIEIEEHEKRIGIEEARVQGVLEQMKLKDEVHQASLNQTVAYHKESIEQVEGEKRLLENQISDLEFRLTESLRVSNFAQSNAARILKAKEESQAEADRKIAELEYHVTSANRVAAFAQKNLVKLQKEKEDQENETANEVAGLKFRLMETERMVMFLQKRLEQTQKQSSERELSADGRIAELTNSLTQAKQMVNFLQNRLANAEAKMQREVAELEFKVTELGRVNTFMQNKLVDTEAKAGAKIADLEFRLTESTRLSKFMHNRLDKAAEMKKSDAEKLEDLEIQVYSLRAKLEEKEQRIAESVHRAELQNSKMESMFHHMQELECNMKVSNQVIEFLQSALARSEEQNILARMQ